MPPNDTNTRLLNEITGIKVEISGIKADIRELRESRHNTDQRAMVASEKAAEGVERIKVELQELTQLLTGNGDPAKGLVVRFDRIEVAHAKTAALVKTLIGAIITGIVGMIFYAVKHGG